MNPIAWEFNYVKNQDPTFAACGYLLQREADDAVELACEYDESNKTAFDDTDDRLGWLPDLITFWKSS
jgi:hypothetical protein